MKLSQFAFDLPEESIALYPHSFKREFTDENGKKSSFNVIRRDESRLMVLHRVSGEIEMYKKDAKGNPIKGEFLDFRNILDYFDEGDTFVFNDTKVFPARLYGMKEKTDAKIEVFLLRELNADQRLWDVLVEPARKIRIGNKLFFDDSGSMVAEVIDNTTSRGRTLRFLYDCPHDEFKRELFALGEAPLPRYIVDARTAILHEDMKKNPKKYENMKDEQGNPIPSPLPDDFSHATAEDMEYFQCIYAKNGGAVTAPATGLHFSRELMKRMEIKGINCAYITLHCGLGNFNDIEVEDLTKHKMDSEQMFVNKEACDIVNKTKQAGHHVCAIGTSVVKATETAVGTDGFLKEYEGWTNKFIFPPYDFGLADTMVANFYHPKSTLLMETAAFGGYDNVMECYELAVQNGYKFGCFGDSLLIVND
jgi:S-adenosylmethionine:tRNA ribosyltransferase-isomerase